MTVSPNNMDNDGHSERAMIGVSQAKVSTENIDAEVRGISCQVMMSEPQ